MLATVDAGASHVETAAMDLRGNGACLPVARLATCALVRSNERFVCPVSVSRNQIEALPRWLRCAAKADGEKLQRRGGWTIIAFAAATTIVRLV